MDFFLPITAIKFDGVELVKSAVSDASEIYADRVGMGARIVVRLNAASFTEQVVRCLCIEAIASQDI